MSLRDFWGRTARGHPEVSPPLLINCNEEAWAALAAVNGPGLTLMTLPSFSVITRLFPYYGEQFNSNFVLMLEEVHEIWDEDEEATVEKLQIVFQSPFGSAEFLEEWFSMTEAERAPFFPGGPWQPESARHDWPASSSSVRWIRKVPHELRARTVLADGEVAPTEGWLDLYVQYAVVARWSGRFGL